MFIADFILQFFISFIDSKTRLVLEGPLIAHNYIGSKRFYYDLVPFVVGARWMSEVDIHFKLARMFKLFNAVEVISTSRNNLTKFVSAITGIIRLMIVIGLMLHLICCYYYKVCISNKDKIVPGHPINESQQWYPPTYFINYPDSPLFTDELTTN